jgi:hypothetical protein
VVGTTWAWRAWRESRVAEVQVRAKRKARMRGGYHERGAEGKIRIAEEL